MTLPKLAPAGLTLCALVSAQTSTGEIDVIVHEPANTAGNAGYGTITATAVTSRQLQLAMHLAF